MQVATVMLHARTTPALLLIALSLATGCSKSRSPQAPPGAPAAPSMLQATVGFTNLTLTWTDNSNDEDLFQIKRKVNSGPWEWHASTLPNTTTWQATLSFGNDYLFAVSAENSNGESLWSNIVPVHVDAPIGGFGGGGANCGIILAIPVGAADAAGAAPERGPGTPVDALFLVDGALGTGGVCEQHALSATAPSFLLDADRQGAVRTRFMGTAPAMGEAARVLTIGLTLLPYPRGRTPEIVDTFIALHDQGTGAFTSRYSAFGLAAWQPYTPPWLPEPGVPLTLGHEYLLQIEIEAVTGRWNAWLEGLPVAFGCGLDDMIRVRVRPVGS